MPVRRAVVTGGAGFLGSHLCQRLLQVGYEVICLDDFCTGSSTNVEHLLEDRRFRLVRADITDYVHVSGHVDAVLHLASPASPIDYQQLPLHTLKVGSIGTLHSLGLAKDNEARFLLASTSESYGDPLVHPQLETYWGNVNPVGPRAVYDEAKRFAEATTMAYRKARGVDTAIARIFNTFGPRMRPWDGRAIPTFIGQALRGEPLTVAGDGSQTRSVCYVDDLIEGLIRLLHSDLEGPVNLGNCAEMSILELARLITDLTDSSSEIIFVDRPQDDPTVRRPDITLARTALGWEPTVDLRDGLLRTIDWFRSQSLVLEPVAVPVTRQLPTSAGPPASRVR
jgi:dTDP-glucose 4,6-dehydratase